MFLCKVKNKKKQFYQEKSDLFLCKRNNKILLKRIRSVLKSKRIRSVSRNKKLKEKIF